MSVFSPIESEEDFSYSTPDQPVVMRTFIRTVERLTGQMKLRDLYFSRTQSALPAESFFEQAIRLLELELDVREQTVINPPSTGPVIFIANHPYGVLDGLIFTCLVQRLRPDAKVMANSVLCCAPEARPHLLPVDFSPTKDALKTNLDTRKQAMKIVCDGGAIGLFPAGGVGASHKMLKGPALDPQWSPFLAKLVQKSGATVVPLFFAGQNSRLFQIASHTNYPLRLALFFYETRRLIGKRIKVAIGDPVGSETLAALLDKQEMLTYLRRKTFGLAHGLDLPANRVPNPEQSFSYPERFRL